MGQRSWLSLKALCGPVTLVPASSLHSIFLLPEVLSPLLMLFLLFGMPFLFFLLTVCSLCQVQFKCQLHKTVFMPAPGVDSYFLLWVTTALWAQDR